jgi:hypothetical protein
MSTWASYLRFATLTSALLGGSALPLAGQEPPKHALVATASCVDCHFKSANAPADIFQVQQFFCRREQTELWENQDKHRRSFDLIAKGEGLALTNQILGFPLGEVLELNPPARTDGLVAAARFHPNLPAGDPLSGLPCSDRGGSDRHGGRVYRIWCFVPSLPRAGKRI